MNDLEAGLFLAKFFGVMMIVFISRYVISKISQKLRKRRKK